MTAVAPKDEIVTHIPALRAFALSLTFDPAAADDLVQDTLIKGWSRMDQYKAGTNMRAWLFTILRNTFYSDRRKSGREVGYDDIPLRAQLSILPDHDGRLALEELREALGTLPVNQREALMLITVIGVTYEEAAATCNVATGTIKSRVNRARVQLAALLELDA